MAVTLVPIYQSEISPPDARGFLVGQHGTWIVFGYSLAGWVGVGSYYSNNLQFQWRFPIAMSIVPPLVLLLCSPLVPESPRYLLARGRREEAWVTVQRLRAVDKDGADVYARREFEQMCQQVEIDNAVWAETGYKALFVKPSFRTRMWMGFFIQYAAQSTGAQVIYSA
jgi:MFS family permease